VEDVTPPEITTCASDPGPLSLDAGCEVALPDLTGDVLATDNCGAPVITQDPDADTMISADTVVTLTATDGVGLTDTCQVTVTVVDSAPPQITACASDPGPLSLGAGCEVALPDLTGDVLATDNCGAPVITQDPDAGTMISADTVVTLTATDGAGLTDTCEVTVTVLPCAEGGVCLNTLSDGATVYVSSSAGPVPLIVTVTAPAGTQSVTYWDPESTETQTLVEPPYALLIWLDPSVIDPEDRTIGVTALLEDNSVQSTSKTVAFAAPPENSDSDVNGMPDNPFAFLEPGDLWLNLRYVHRTEATQMTSVKCVDAQTCAGRVRLDVAGGESTETRVTVSVPGDLVEPGETGLVVVATAPDLDTLLGGALAPQMSAAPEGYALSTGGMYAEVSLLMSTDGGNTYSEVHDDALDANPMDAAVTLPNAPGASAALYSYPTEILTDPLTGLYISPIGDGWSTDSVSGSVLQGVSLSRRLTSVSVIAPFETSAGEGEGEGEGESEGEGEDESPAGCLGGSLDNKNGSGFSILPMLVLAAFLFILSNNRAKDAFNTD
jgi:hypothetical protein